MGALEGRGAAVSAIQPYAWNLPADPAPLERLVLRLIAGQVDALLFTNGARARHLFAVAARLDLLPELGEALAHRVPVASVGAVTERVLSACGIVPRIRAPKPTMGALIVAVARGLEAAPSPPPARSAARAPDGRPGAARVAREPAGGSVGPGEKNGCRAPVALEILEHPWTTVLELEEIARAVRRRQGEAGAESERRAVRRPDDGARLALYGWGPGPYTTAHMARRRVHLTFPGTLADEPIMWQLCQDFNLVFNIRQADMAESVGWMMLQLEGDDEDLERGVRWLEDKGIKVAPIEQDVVQ